ncbi:MAG: HAD-IA family hydrolase [Pseudohongiellaceae bacterium]
MPEDNFHSSPTGRSVKTSVDASIECVLFDLDGTLVDTAPDFITVMQQLLMDEGREPVADELIRQTVSDGARALVKLGFEIEEPDPEYLRLHSRLLELYHDQLLHSRARAYPGMRELLDKLDATGTAWGIVTNKPEYLSTRLLQKLDLVPRCKALVCPDHVIVRKPDPEALLLACSQLGVTTERTVYIGDHIRDIQAARNADIIAVAAAWGYLHPDTVVEEWGADFILRSPEKTEALLAMLKFV